MSDEMYLYDDDSFARHLRSLIVCDQFGNKPCLKGIRNHMKIAPEMMELWFIVRKNRTLCNNLAIEECLNKLEKKAKNLYP